MYKIDVKKIKMQCIGDVCIFLFGFSLFVAFICLYFSDSSNQQFIVKFAYFFVIAFVCFPLILGLKNIIKTYIKIKKIKFLSKNGILVKGLPYTVTNSTLTINNKKYFSIEVEFKLPNGNIKKLISEPMFDLETLNSFKEADILAAPDDLNNYYIDFAITKIN